MKVWLRTNKTKQNSDERLIRSNLKFKNNKVN